MQPMLQLALDLTVITVFNRLFASFPVYLFVFLSVCMNLRISSTIRYIMDTPKLKLEYTICSESLQGVFKKLGDFSNFAVNSLSIIDMFFGFDILTIYAWFVTSYIRMIRH